MWHMRQLSNFAVMGALAGALIAASGPASAGTIRGSGALGARHSAVTPAMTRPASRACHAPAGRPVLVSGRGAVRGRTVGKAPHAVLRVDQIGYPTDSAKLAVIMTRPRHPSLGWELIRRRSCAVVADGMASTDFGSWSSTYTAVWAISFSSVRAPGIYRLALTADPAAASPWFRIAPPATLYSRPLRNALSFYQNERDGPDYIHSGLRTAPGDQSDLSAMTYRSPKVSPNGNFKGSLKPYATGVRINASGGWFDAGDNLHFTDTTSYTVAMLLQGIASFPRQMGGHGQVSFMAEAKFGLNFLQRMWNEKTRTLYLQVGTGEANNYYFADHDIWRLPQADDTYGGTNPRYLYIRHPPVFRAGRPGAPISPNLAGRLTADFALCYRVFRATKPAYAARCLRSAETVYSLAGTYWKGKLQTVLPWDFYPESSWRDDMMLGATELALALESGGHAASLPAGLPVRSPSTYLADAAHWASAWIGSKADMADTLNLYDVSALADYELYHAIQTADEAGGAASTHLAVTPAELIADLRGQIQRAMSTGAGNPFDFGFAWDQWDTTTHGLGLSVMAGEYDALTQSASYAAWGQRQLDDVLGVNAWGESLIVGDGTDFPYCMQHQIANIAGSHDGRRPLLAGAVVEGPNSFAAVGFVSNMRACATNAPGDVPYAAFRGHKAVFRDNVQSYSTVEPAIDLTSLSPMAFAWQEAGRNAGY
jgi:endoglucanase